MKVRLTEDKLHRLVYECVRTILGESKPGIQSQKLYDILQKHGGIRKRYAGDRNGDNNGLDVHNLRDEDIVTVMPLSMLRQIQSDRRYVVDHGRWAENYALDVWAKGNNINLKPGDRMSYLELGDNENVVIIVNRNESQVKGREGEGWDAYYQKKEKRRNDGKNDGKYDYIHKYRRPWDWSRQWKNPYKRTDSWDKETIDKDMNSIRNDYALGNKRETNY